MVACSIHSSYILTRWRGRAGRVSVDEETDLFCGIRGTNVGLFWTGYSVL